MPSATNRKDNLPDTLNGVELLRTGTFTSAEGESVTFTQEDLKSLAESYDPAVFESPAVVGHPRMNDPAYGWVKGLRVEGDKLIGDIGDVVSSFADAVRRRIFPKISVQLWPRGSKASPKPDAPYLKHVGFLGAAAPAVKGLKPVSFSDDDQAGCTTIETPVSTTPPTSPTLKEISMSEVNIELDAELKARADKIAADEADLKAKQEAHAESVRSFAESQAKARKDASLSFADGLVTAGKLAPAAKDQIAFLHETLAADDVQSFGEGDDAEPALAIFTRLFDSANPIVSLGEHAPRAKGEAAEVDAETLAEEAQSFVEEQKKAGKTVSVQQAVRHVAAKRAAA